MVVRTSEYTVRYLAAAGARADMSQCLGNARDDGMELKQHAYSAVVADKSEVTARAIVPPIQHEA